MVLLHNDISGMYVLSAILEAVRKQRSIMGLEFVDVAPDLEKLPWLAMSLTSIGSRGLAVYALWFVLGPRGRQSGPPLAEPSLTGCENDPVSTGCTSIYDWEQKNA